MSKKRTYPSRKQRSTSKRHRNPLGKDSLESARTVLREALSHNEMLSDLKESLFGNEILLNVTDFANLLFNPLGPMEAVHNIIRKRDLRRQLLHLLQTQHQQGQQSQQQLLSCLLQRKSQLEQQHPIHRWQKETEEGIFS